MDNSIFAFSAASFNLWRAIGSLFKSNPDSFLNSSIKKLIKRESKSSPPRCVSPDVEITSNWYSPSTLVISIIDISKVPPPRSYTAITPSFFSLSSPKAKAAAVGSLIILSTLSPAILPAASVAFLCESLKYAGTVTTALSTLEPR